MKTLRSLVSLIALVSLACRASATVAPDPELPDYKPAAPVTGSVTAQVPPHLQLLMTAWLDAFRKFHPDAKITQVTKETDIKVYIIGMGPNIDEAYESTIGPWVAKYNYDPARTVVCMGGLLTTERPQAMGLFVNPENPLKKISLAQLDAIYSASRRRGGKKVIATWGQLGLTGDWEKQPIHAYVRPLNNRVTWYFRDDVMLGGLFRPSYIVPGKGTSDQVVDAVAKDKYGISFGAMGYKTDKVSALAIEDAEGNVSEPTEQDVANGKYPLARTLEVFVNRAPGKPLDPVIKEFLTFVLSKDGQAVVSNDKEDGFMPVPARMAQIFRGKLENPPK